MANKKIQIVNGDAVSTWSVDLSAWKVKTSKQWTEALRNDDLETVTELLTGMADTLPNGEPITLENIEELSLAELAEVMYVVQDATNAIFRKARESR